MVKHTPISIGGSESNMELVNSFELGSNGSFKIYNYKP